MKREREEDGRRYRDDRRNAADEGRGDVVGVAERLLADLLRLRRIEEAELFASSHALTPSRAVSAIDPKRRARRG